MRRKLVAGNWKMNGDISFAKQFASGLRERVENSSVACDVMIAPPAYLYTDLSAIFNGSQIRLAAQNVAEYEQGAYTGELSAAMVADAGCAASLIGHSERRTLFAESDQQVVSKVQRLLEKGIQPILCVGETLQERDQGQAQQVVGEQVDCVLKQIPIEQLSSLVIAYEPVWAIGTGRTATPDQAQEMHAHIRQVVAGYDQGFAQGLTILYGGSVNSVTAKELFAQNDIDGGLVGGASLKVDEFFAICQAF